MHLHAGEAADRTADASDIRLSRVPLHMRNGVRLGNLLKILWSDGQGVCLFAKRLEHGRFIWPSPADGVVTISAGQLGYLLEGIDWRMPQRTWRPERAG
ncbi:MAG TPA: IS66 family insertion sequence element accessory protein TnpB [Vicinamibacterales bacterium]|nr:IS66 family insertion sequence element accessory protein TnpB [Vicinamibacterales bacterium]